MSGHSTPTRPRARTCICRLVRFWGAEVDAKGDHSPQLNARPLRRCRSALPEAVRGSWDSTSQPSNNRPRRLGACQKVEIEKWVALSKAAGIRPRRRSASAIWRVCGAGLTPCSHPVGAAVFTARLDGWPQARAAEPSKTPRRGASRDAGRMKMKANRFMSHRIARWCLPLR